MQARRRFARVLLTNDDGLGAEGLVRLERVASTLADEVWVVAPEHDRSGTSRSVSLSAPLRLYPRGPWHYAVDGTPADCVILALRHLLRDTPPDLVLSGINRGANLGQEVAFSGTVGAALAARLMGVPAIAFSQAFRDRAHVRWDTAETLVAETFTRLDILGEGGLGEGALASRGILNVNFPDVPAAEVTGWEATGQAQGPLLDIAVDSRTDTRGGAYHWLAFRRLQGDREDGTDIAALRKGAVSVTPLGFDFTDTGMLAQLTARLGAGGA